MKLQGGTFLAVGSMGGLMNVASGNIHDDEMLRSHEKFLVGFWISGLVSNPFAVITTLGLVFYDTLNHDRLMKSLK